MFNLGITGTQVNASAYIMPSTQYLNETPNGNLVGWSLNERTAMPPGSAVPEMSSISLLAFGLLGLFGVARRKI